MLAEGRYHKNVFKVGSFEVMVEKLQPHFQIEDYLMCDIITILEKFVFIFKSFRVAKYGFDEKFFVAHILVGYIISSSHKYRPSSFNVNY